MCVEVAILKGFAYYYCTYVSKNVIFGMSVFPELWLNVEFVWLPKLYAPNTFV